MIIVRRLNGEQFGLNAEHIERVEETPDTVLTLQDGRKYIVKESLQEVLDRVVEYRARILRVSYATLPPDEEDETPLRLIAGDGETSEATPNEDRRH